MRYLLTILMVLFFSQVSAQLKYVMSPGEYTAVFKKVSTGIAYTIGTDPSQLGGTGGVGTQGIPIEISTIPANKPMAGVCSGLHDFGTYSIDSGRVFMAGQANNCQLGNGTTTGPTTMYEILTDAGGNQFDSIGGMTAGWCISAAAPFYAAYKWYNAASTYNNAVYIWGDGSTVGLGSCIKPTATFVGGFGSGEVIQSISAQNSSIHCITTDGKLWVLGGTDDYPANTGTNSTPTTWTQVTLPGGQLASFMCKGNSFVFVVSTTGHLISFGEYGWISENKSTNAFTPITTPTQVDSYFPSSIFPISQMVAAHTAYAILTTTNKLFTGGSNEIGICGTGSTIYWPTYTGTNGLAPYDWDVAMGEYVNQCTQIAKNANVTWSQIFGGPLYSFYFLAEDNNGNLYGAGRDKAGGIPDGEIPADTLNAGSPSIAADYNMSWNHLWFTSLPDPLSLTSSIVASCPSCVTGYLTGVPCSYGTDAPSRPNTNLAAHLIITPTANGFTWSSSTSTTDGSHKIMWSQSFITQHSGTSIGLGVQGGESGSVTGIAAGTYVLNDTIVDNAWDTAFTTASVTVGSQTGFYCDTVGGSDANACTFPSPCASKAHTISQMVSGDTLYMKCNDVWYSTTYPISGIVITSYGTGNKPKNDGSQTLSAWTSMGNGIWEAYLPNDRATLNCVTLNGNLAGMGRYPDTGYLIYTGLTSSMLTSPALTGLTYSYVNGTVCIRPEFSDLDTLHINAQSSTTLTLATSPSILGGRGNGFFFMNHPNTLLTTTRIGSWYNKVSVDSVQMYFGSAGPSGQVVKIAVLDTGIYLSGLSNVTVENVDFDYFNQYNVFENGTSNILFDSCKVGHSGNNAVTANNAAHSTFRYDTLKNVNNNGAYATGSSSTYPVWQYCLLDSIGMWAGMGQTGASNAYTAIAWGYGFGSFKFNTLANIGFNGIYFAGDSCKVVNNFTQNYCEIKCDGGAYYTWYGSLPSLTYGDSVIGNIAINSGSPGSGIVYDYTDIAFGFYLDNYATKVTLYGNTAAYNTSGGAFVHGAANKFVNNNWYGNLYSQFIAAEISSHAITGMVYTGNIHGTTGTSFSVVMTSPNNDLNSFCTTCNLNYYLNPIGQTGGFYTKSSVDPGTGRSFASWQSNTGYDAGSSYQNGVLSFVYSVPGGKISLGYNAKDALGNIYPGIINLPSYGSSTLLQLPCSCIQVPVGSKILVQ
jgi:hypothetical protein